MGTLAGARIIFAVYLIVLLVLGWYASRKIKHLVDFYVAGQNMPWYAVGLSVTATHIGTATVVGATGLVYRFGMGVSTTFYSTILGVALIGGMIVGVICRRAGVYTVPEFLGNRYDSEMLRVISSVIILVTMVIYVGVGLIGLSLVTQEITGISYLNAVILTSIVVVFYTFLGGQYGVIWTDMLQAIIFTFGAIVALPFALRAGGGFGNILQTIHDVNPKFWTFTGSMPLYLVVGLTLGFTFGNACRPDFLTRIMSARSEKDGIKAMMLAGPWFIISWFVFVLIAAAGVVIFPGLEDVEKVWIKTSLEVLPPFVGALGLAAVVAAGMSSIDSQLLAASGSFARDVFQQHIYRKGDERLQLKLAQITTVIIGLFIAPYIAIVRPGYILVISSIVAAVWACFFWPFILGIFWKGATKAAATASTISCASVIVITWFIFDVLKIYKPPAWAPPIIWGISTSLIVFAVISFLTKPTPQEVSYFAWIRNKPASKTFDYLKNTGEGTAADAGL